MNNSEVFQKIALFVDSYVESSLSPDSKVVEHKTPSELEKLLALNLKSEPGSIEDVFDAIEKYLKYSVKTAHKQYFNQLWAGFSMPAFLGEVFASLTNASMFTYEMSPVATLLENHLIEKLNSYCGFTHGEGLFVTGGSNANLVAVLAARNTKFPDSKRKGMVFLDKQPVFFTSDQAHYSFLKAANIIGIGMDSVIKVKSDENGRMIPKELDRQIEKSIKDGKTPFMIAATSGTTVLNAFDPVNEIADIAEKYDLWLHVDGSFGASTLLSNDHNHFMKGVERADSLTWNPHKMMGLPLVCSTILMREKGNLFKSASSNNKDEQYIFHHGDNYTYDLGLNSLQCGRKVDSLKLWLAWIYYGDSGFERRIQKAFELSEYAENRVKQISDLELVKPRQSISVCFRYNNGSIADLNKFNVDLREKLLKSGKSMINYADVGGKTVLRLVTLNPELEFRDIDRFFENIISCA